MAGGFLIPPRGELCKFYIQFLQRRPSFIHTIYELQEFFGKDKNMQIVQKSADELRPYQYNPRKNLSHVHTAMKNNSRLMTRCVLSTLCGEGLDACIFISIAFIGTMPVSQLIIMVLAQAIFKTAYEIVVYPLTSTVIKKARTLQEA